MNTSDFKTPSFFLGTFEGPLELLLFLIQREEVDLYEISLNLLTKQMLELLEKEEIDKSSEAVSLASLFLLMKSQKLLPHDQILEEVDGQEKPFHMLQKLIEYCQFRDAAQLLAEREEKQLSFFTRGSPVLRKEPGTGLEEVGLQDLKALLLEAVAKSEKNSIKVIREEPWQVEDKIKWFNKELTRESRLPFYEVFSEEKSKEELICLFLALLELMKQQFLQVVRECEFHYIIRHDARS